MAINLPDVNNENIYYICDEKTNNDYIYIGFLSKSKNPNSLCMPCCFKKNQQNSINTNIKDYFN